MDTNFDDETNSLSSLADKLSLLEIGNDIAPTSNHKATTTITNEDSSSQSSSDEDEVDEDEDNEDSGEETEEEGKRGYKKGGYHPVSIGDVYKDRYEVISKLGWGHFSTVWLARDRLAKYTDYVALKVVKSAEQYTEAAEDEIELLQCVSKHSTGEHYVVRLYDNFIHSGPNGDHIIMVFEVLGKNILHLIDTHYKGLPIPVVKSIVKQILTGLDFLHRVCRIIHTDLKPENILLFDQENIKSLHSSQTNNSSQYNNYNNLQSRRSNSLDENVRIFGSKMNGDVNNNNNYKTYENGVSKNKPHEITMVKIADLGNACWVDKHFTDCIQTRQYRAPEAIIRYEYGTSVDIWSLACITFELATGDLLFKPKKGDNHSKSDDHLALILEVTNQNKYPKHMISEAKREREFFKRDGRLRNIANLKFWPLERVLLEKYKFNKEDAKRLSNFLLPMLRLDPNQRITAEEALRHEWLVDADLSTPIPIAADYSESESDSDDEEEDDEDDDEDDEDDEEEDDEEDDE